MLSAIPNIITSIRFLLVIPISVYIYQGNDLLALTLFIVAGLSDGLDGYLARKYNWISKFGQFLDPLADKFLIVGTLLALAFTRQTSFVVCIYNDKQRWNSSCWLYFVFIAF